MTQFLLGALVMGSTSIGVFFLRFWRETHDRLFVMFAFAFWILALGWLGQLAGAGETNTPFYALRLVAFLLIILAVADKNRGSGRR